MTKTGIIHEAYVAYSADAVTGKGITIVDEVIRLVINDELGKVDQALVDWVRSKRPSGYDFPEALDGIQAFEEALLEDLEQSTEGGHEQS